MIERLDTVERFGPFGSFSWPNDLPHFANRNVVFGWNASGKTSVARLLACLEQQKMFPEDEHFAKGKFSIATASGLALTERNLDAAPPVRVYNPDFVDREFSFTEDKRLNLINVVMGESAKSDLKAYDDARDRVAALEKQKRAANSAVQAAQQQRENFLSDKASAVRNAIGVKGNLFNTTKLEKLFQEMSASEKPTLTAPDKARLLKEMQIQSKPTLSGSLALPWQSAEALDVFIARAQEALGKEIVKDSVEGLSGDPVLNRWLQDGLKLHQGKEHCEFCGGVLTVNRVEQLQARFSNAYKELQEVLKECRSTAVAAKNSVSTTPGHDKHTFDDTLLEKYETAENDYIKAAAALREQIDSLITALETKEDSLFEITEYEPTPLKQCFDSAEESVKQIHTLVDQHNKLQDDVAGRRQSAFERLARDESARYGSDNQSLLHEIAKADKQFQEATQGLNEAKTLLQEARAKVVQPAKGADTANEYMRYLLCSDAISLVHSEAEGGYRLMRGDSAARHLSEGEKTAITFAYFIATLEDESVDLSETTIVVDDPVSSLDSNKVHATYGLIWDKLWGHCKQLFILTHHFQFLKLFPGPTEDKTVWYVMEGDSSSQPSIATCPRLITDFQSEYYYLFYRLHHLVPDDSNFYISRNILRRFLEALLEFKYGAGDFRSKLDRWFDDSRIPGEMYGVLNAGSHPNGVDDFSDPRRFREMVYRVCMSIKAKDPDHHHALVRHLNRDTSKCKPPRDGSPCKHCALLNA